MVGWFGGLLCWFLWAAKGCYDFIGWGGSFRGVGLFGAWFCWFHRLLLECSGASFFSLRRRCGGVVFVFSFGLVCLVSRLAPFIAFATNTDFFIYRDMVLVRITS